MAIALDEKIKKKLLAFTKAVVYKLLPMKKNLFVYGLVLMLLLATGTAEVGGEEKPRVFVEMAGGVGTDYVKYFISQEGIREINKTSSYGMWSPSVGLQLDDRWAIGARMTFETGGDWLTTKYTITTLYGQYAFLRGERWSVFAEGKGSLYHVHYYGKKGGEIGVSLGGKYDVTRNLGIVVHYVYAGVEVGKDKVLSSPGGCIGKHRAMLDFSPRRLQLGLRYTF